MNKSEFKRAYGALREVRANEIQRDRARKAPYKSKWMDLAFNLNLYSVVECMRYSSEYDNVPRRLQVWERNATKNNRLP